MGKKPGKYFQDLNETNWWSGPSLETCLKTDDEWVVPDKVYEWTGFSLFIDGMKKTHKKTGGRRFNTSRLKRFFTKLPLNKRVADSRLDFMHEIYSKPKVYESVSNLVELLDDKPGCNHANYSNLLIHHWWAKDFVDELLLLDPESPSEEIRKLSKFGQTMMQYGSFKDMVAIVEILEEGLEDKLRRFKKVFFKERETHCGETKREWAWRPDNYWFKREVFGLMKVLQDSFPLLNKPGWLDFEIEGIGGIKEAFTRLEKGLDDSAPIFNTSYVEKPEETTKYLRDNKGEIIGLIDLCDRLLYSLLKSKLVEPSVTGGQGDIMETFLDVVDYLKDANKKGLTVMRPTIEEKEKRVFSMESAINPALYEGLGEKTIPITFDFDPEEPVQNLTGPNNGGKSSLSRHVVLLQMKAQAGSLVTAEGATISPVDGIYISAPSGDDMLNHEGAYEAYLNVFERNLQQCTPYSLLIMDELGIGTDPSEGKRVSEEVYQKLARDGIRTIHPNHLFPLAQGALDKKYKGVRAWGILQDGDGNSLYTPTLNVLGKSNGKTVADAAGLSKEDLKIMSTKLEKRFPEFYKK